MAVSNKDVEVLSEALFCYYFAIWKKGKQKQYDPEIWDTIKSSSDLTKWTSKLGITSIVGNVNSDPAFKSRLSKVPEFLSKNKNKWANALVSQMDAFFGNSRVKIGNQQYYAMRADMIPNSFNPYEVYKKISKKVKQHRDFSEEINPTKEKGKII